MAYSATLMALLVDDDGIAIADDDGTRQLANGDARMLSNVEQQTTKCIYGFT